MKKFFWQSAIFSVLLANTCNQTFAANAEWDQATRLYSSGDYRGALSAFQKIAEKMPRDPSVHYMLGQCYKSLNNTKQATSELDWVSKYATDPRIKSGAASLLAQMKGGGGGPIAGNTIPGAISPYNARQAASNATASAAAAKADATPPSKALINDSVSQTVAAASSKGWVPCRNPGCLNYGTNGWHHAKKDGYPDSYMWVDFKCDDKSGYWSQNHVGDLIKDCADAGPCPTCQGSGWVRK